MLVQESSTPAVGSCRKCGYPLKGLTSDRCPECGRPFDPTDPKTMNMGRRPGWFAKRLMTPIGWPTVLLMFIGTAAIAWTTRLQDGYVWEWKAGFYDLRLYGDPALRQLDKPLVTTIDWIYVSGIVLTALAIAFLLVRCLLGVATRLRYRTSLPAPLIRRRIILFLLLLASVSAISVAYGWPFRIGQRWAADRVNGSSLRGRYQLALQPSGELQEVLPWALDAARRHGANDIRLAAMVQTFEYSAPEASLQKLRETAANDKDPSGVAAALQLLALLQHPLDLQLLEDKLDSPDAVVREAAALGLTHGSRSSRAFPLLKFELTTVAPPAKVMLDPRVWFLKIIPYLTERGRGSYSFGGFWTLSPWTKEKLTRQMYEGQTPSERQAAADAIAGESREDPKLRVAEWGVWIDPQHSKSPTLGEGMHDGIPAFVHRYGGTDREIRREATATPLVLSGAVMHWYSKVPLSAVFRTQISHGRIDQVYPKPDQLGHSFTTFFQRPDEDSRLGPSLPGASRAALHPPFRDDRDPRHTSVFQIPQAGLNSRYAASGFVWHSLVVLPEQASWMQLPSLPADPKQAWWAKLRDVPSSWVSSRGESERFVCYGGPAVNESPVMLSEADGGMLMMQTDLKEDPVKEDQPDFADIVSLDALQQTARRRNRAERRGMYIMVSNDKVTGEIVPVPATGKKPDKPSHAIGSGRLLAGDSNGMSEAEGMLRQWVIEAGLTEAEADGMMFAWRSTLFAKEGRRFVLLMSALDYDELCPISILPKPTELARVGLVWTEFETSKTK